MLEGVNCTYEECPNKVVVYTTDRGDDVCLIKTVDEAAGCYTDKWLFTDNEKVYPHDAAMALWGYAFKRHFDALAEAEVDNG